MFWDNFTALCAKHNTSPTQVITKLNISRGSVTHWKKGITPQSTNLHKIAGYFKVPIEYLTEESHQRTGVKTNSRRYKMMQSDVTRVNEAAKTMTQEVKARNQAVAGLRSARSSKLKNIETLTELEKLLLDTFRSTTDSGRLKILSAAAEIKKEEAK